MSRRVPIVSCGGCLAILALLPTLALARSGGDTGDDDPFESPVEYVALATDGEDEPSLWRLPAGGAGPFVGRGLKPLSVRMRTEFGTRTQVSPLDVALVDRGVPGYGVSATHLEPFVTLRWRPIEVGASVPMSLALDGAGATSSATLGNVTLDVKGGWWFPVRRAFLGVATGMSIALPTAGRGKTSGGGFDPFLSPKVRGDHMTLAPYVIAGIDAKWVAWQVQAEFWSQVRIRGSGPSDAWVFHYATSLVLLPHFPVSVVGELAGVEGLRHAGDHRTLFAVAGVQLRVWVLRLGAALQVPLHDRAPVDLGPIAGYGLERWARYTILVRGAVSF